jgi:hypothetical protein
VLDNGTSLEDVQSAAGHAAPSTMKLYNVIVEIRDPWMALIVIDIYVGDSRMGAGKIVERPVGAEVLEGNHIDRADEIALPVIRQKRLYGEGAEVDIQYPDTGEKLWKLDERAHFPEGLARQGQALCHSLLLEEMSV